MQFYYRIQKKGKLTNTLDYALSPAEIEWVHAY